MSTIPTYVYDDKGRLIERRDDPVPPEQVAERTANTEAGQALASLQALADGTGPMTAAQLTVAVRGMARTLVVLVRLVLRRFV